MIYFFTPYSFENKLFEAYDRYMNLVPDKNDWACFLDGDTLFFENDFGHQVQEYIDKYPGTGLFTSYASRSAYHFMVPRDTNQESDSIRYHRQRSAEIRAKLHSQVKPIENHIAGHLMCIKKATWDLIRPKLLKSLDGANLLGVDTQVSNAVRSSGLKILLMRGIYLFHYYRLTEGRNYKDHLIDKTINILIRTSNREQQFNRCLDSIRGQTFRNYKIYVSADDDTTAAYVSRSGIKPILVKKRQKTETETAPWNGYLNDLIAQVKGGWILILDDDDMLAGRDVLQKVTDQLKDDNAIYFLRMIWPTGRVIPSNTNFANHQIVVKDIGMPCFIFHAKHKHKLAFQPIKQGDFHYISRLIQVIKKQQWINLILTRIGNTGANGKPETKNN